MTARTAAEMNAARAMLLPFHEAGYRLFPLRKGKKIPLQSGWQTRDYTLGMIRHWLEQGGNVGIALGAEDLVVDVDPRNFEDGDDPLKRLRAAFDIDISMVPTNITGSGGCHLFFKKPEDLRIRGRLDGYEGIDFKTGGGLVVAPGSRHPETGRLYESHDLRPPITEVQMALAALLEALRRPDRQQISSTATIGSGRGATRGDAAHDIRAGGEGVGILTLEQLAQLLAVLDPRDYGQGHYDAWLGLAAACHDATAGGGLEVWLEWCEGDEDYADEKTVRRNVATWNSFIAGRTGGATYRTLFKAVVDAGRADLVAALGDDDDAIEEDFIVYEIETETDDG